MGMRNKRLLVTGALGFIGRNLISHLAESPYETWFIDRKPRLPGLRENYIEMDITNPVHFEEALNIMPDEYDACIHLAAQTDIPYSVKYPDMDRKLNVQPIVDIMHYFRIKRFVYVSTGSVYQGQTGQAQCDIPLDPALPYAVSKYTAELALKEMQEKNNNPMEYVILRLFNPYGPFGVPKRFIHRVVKTFGIEKSNRFDISGSGKALVDPIYVDDVCASLIRSIDSKCENKIMDICSGNPVTLTEFVKTVASFFEIKPEIEYSGDSNEEITFYGSPDLARELLGFSPSVPLRDGIMKYRDFLLKSKEEPIYA